MQLGQAELVGAVHDDGVGAGHVDAGLDDGRAHQNVVLLVIELLHDLLQLALAHLPVGDADARFRHQRHQFLRALLDAVDLVVQVVDLTAAQQFAQDGFLDHRRMGLAHKGLHRQAACWWRGDDGQVAHAGEGHVQRARNRRGGQR